jgi:hypothetical protein
VGVIEDAPTNHLREQIEPYFYFPFAQMRTGEVTFFLETAGDPTLLAAPVRALARRNSANFALQGTRTMRQHMFAARKYDALLTGLLVTMAPLGLLLAAAGLFGVTTYAVSRRMREFGLRIALGATGKDLQRQVLKLKTALQAAIGIPLGWALATASRQLIQSVLFGARAPDQRMLVAGSGVVALALAAALRPALSAARVDQLSPCVMNKRGDAPRVHALGVSR